MARKSTGVYPDNWPEIAQAVKEEAGWSCVRCGHGHDPAAGYTLTVHHLDLDPANCRWWNIPALCQRCHLHIQAAVIMERPFMFEHTGWFKPYVAGYYAYTLLGEDLTREETAARLDDLLALGQPWRLPDGRGCGANHPRLAGIEPGPMGRYGQYLVKGDKTMAYTITTKTAIVNVQINMDVDDAKMLTDCLPHLPTDRPAFWAISAFLEGLADEIAYDPSEGINRPVPTIGTFEESPAPPAPAAPSVPVKTPRQHRDTRPRNIDEAWLREQYLGYERSTTDIARELGCANTTVGAYLRKYGIPARPAAAPRRHKVEQDPSFTPAASRGRGAVDGSSS